jgi:hypothetical protein
MLQKDFHSFFQIRVYLPSKLVTIFQLSQFDNWWWSLPLFSLKKSVFLLDSGSKCFSHFICLNLLSLFFWWLYTFIYISHVVLPQLWMCHDHIYLFICYIVFLSFFVVKPIKPNNMKSNVCNSFNYSAQYIGRLDWQ